jgi:hypothetical protein
MFLVYLTLTGNAIVINSVADQDLGPMLFYPLESRKVNFASQILDPNIIDVIIFRNLFIMVLLN